MKYAADFRRIAREALSGKWMIAVLVGLVATLLGGAGSGGPELKLNIDASGAHANFQFAGQTIFSTGGGLNSDIGAFLVGSAIYITIAAIVMAVVYFVLGSIISIGYARFHRGAVISIVTPFILPLAVLVIILEDCRCRKAAPERVCPALVTAPHHPRHHRHLQLRHDGVHPGGASGPHGQRGHCTVQGNDVRQPLAPVLPALQLHRLGYPQLSDAGYRQSVAAPL